MQARATKADALRLVVPTDRLDLQSFVGRGAALDEVGVLLARLESGTGGVLVVSGEAGVGKTRLAEETARLAKARGAAVGWGRAWEAGGAPPYWPWTRALRELVQQVPDAVSGDSAVDARVAAVLPELGVHEPDTAAISADQAAADRFALFEAVSTFLQGLASRRPVMVVLDDIHAADEPTLRLLQFVARDARWARLLLVGLYRDREVPRDTQASALVNDVARDGQHLALEGLSDSALEELAATRLGATPPPGLVSALADATGGNPFFAGELLRLHRLRGHATDVDHFDVPPGVRETIRSRLALLPTGTAALLRTARCSDGSSTSRRWPRSSTNAP